MYKYITACRITRPVALKTKKKFSGVKDVDSSIKKNKTLERRRHRACHKRFFLIDDENSNRAVVRRVNTRRPLPGIWSDVCSARILLTRRAPALTIYNEKHQSTAGYRLTETKWCENQNGFEL